MRHVGKKSKRQVQAGFAGVEPLRHTCRRRHLAPRAVAVILADLAEIVGIVRMCGFV